MTRTKLRIVVAVTLALGLPGGAAAQDKKGVPQGPTVRGVLRAVDAEKRTLTVAVPKQAGTKQTEDRTFTLEAGAKIVLQDTLTKGQPAPEGALTDLSPGTEVTLQLTPDGKTVRGLSARGPSLHGHVKSVDAARGTLTVSLKEAGGLTAKELTLAKGAKIILDDGLGKKGDPPQEGTLADLTEGATVVVPVTVNRKTALGVHLQGASLTGLLKGHDAGTRTLTVEVKEDGQLVDRSLTLAKGARVDGELVPGARVAVRLAIKDRAVAVAVHVFKDKE